MSEEQFGKRIDDDIYYCIEKMGAYEIYDVLRTECSFEKMITLYKLIKHKMETLDDEIEIIENTPRIEDDLPHHTCSLFRFNKSEEKKIPEKLDIYDELQTLLANGGGSYDHNIHKMFKKIELKQNEIIDYLKSKGE